MIIEFVLILCVIVLIGCFPLLLQTGSMVPFLEGISSGFYYLVHPQEVTIPLSNGSNLTFFEAVKEKYINSAVILLCSFIIAVVFAVLFTYIASLISNKSKRMLDFSFFIIQSMPDVLIILLAQQFIIWIFKITEFSAISIYELGGEKIYFLPIICLSIIPALHLFKYFHTSISEEKSKDYYLFLKSKGLSEGYVFFIHLLRNTVVTLVSYSKNIILFMISSLLILEILFNMDGIMKFVKVYGIGDYRILILVLVMIYIPSYILIKLGEYIISKWTGYDATMQETKDEETY
ncbi:ABC transporter permease subunit [Bacillus sp. B1-b2]|uniref:ABC transporter permease subunit n=1 Tax=Bacillus sp. B1-b2 TaxID=2653201 RepID=UPI001D00D70A|nr:ABC transporter permease subunit [Bacillus sp. B1-b2]